MKKRAFLIHGWEGNPLEGWRPWLKKNLEEKGFEVTVPAMPDTDNPTLEAWLPFLQKLVCKVDTNTYFVGHSLGCITILRLLEALPEDEKAGGVVLVAGFGSDLKYSGYNHELASFFESPINWNKIKNSCSKFVSIHSSNDPWVEIDNNRLFGQMLGAETLIVPDMKHFSGDDGIQELPVAREKLLEISK